MNNEEQSAYEKAYQEGYAAKTYSECPYKSGQSIRQYFNNGFVDACVKRGLCPPDAPESVAGRIAYRLGYGVTGNRSESWLIGWVNERTKGALITPHSCN